jgi:plastocyanin
MGTLPMLVAILVIGSAGLAPATWAANTSISITDSRYDPGDLTIVQGEVVTWTQNGGLTHTVTADGGSFDSGVLAPGAFFDHAFETPGTYTYHCTLHDMSGRITVLAATPPSSAAPTPTSPSTPIQTAPPTAGQSGHAAEAVSPVASASATAAPADVGPSDAGLSPLTVGIAAVLVILIVVVALFLIPARRDSKSDRTG